MIDFYFAHFAKFVLAFLLALLQLDATVAAAHTSMITVGDEIEGMTLTTGAADARPLRVFCASEVSNQVTTANCRVPQVSRLAIGHVFLGTDVALSDMKWSEMNWELYLDDQYINLNDFGTYDYLLPAMAPNPSPVREVFMKFTAWDVVLTDLQPGVHRMEGRMFADAEEYRWVVNLVIEESSQEQGDSTQSRCSRTGVSLSRFHPACRLYG